MNPNIINKAIPDQVALDAEQQNAIEGVINAHAAFEKVFKGDASKVWQDLLKTDYEGSILNKITHLNK